MVKNDELNDDFESRMMENYSDAVEPESPRNERLAEMNKKLPSWNLEPPHSFIK